MILYWINKDKKYRIWLQMILKQLSDLIIQIVN